MSAPRSVPFDLAAERATLGACLLERDAVIAVAPFLTPDHFYLEKHALVYAAVLACYGRREPPDLATVAAELRRHAQLDLVGGLGSLGELSSETPAAVHVAYYGHIVEAAAVRRRLIETGGQIAALGYEESEDLGATLDQAEQTLFAVSQRRRLRDFVPLSHAVNELYSRVEALHARRGQVSGLPTGYRDLNELTGGLQPSDLILLAARPSIGKTSLALCLAHHVAAYERRNVGVFSFEMSRDQLTQRLLALQTGIDVQRLRTGNLRDDELALAFDGMGALSELPIHIDDTPGLSVTEVRSRARRLASDVGLDLVIVDYLQLMVGKAENRVQEVSEISRGMKALARELNAPVIALSQLSRAVEARSDHVPMLSDLRESGSLEQDADLVWFIYREEVYDRDTDKKGIAELHIAKHRNGPLGIVPLRFEARTTRFWPLDPYRAPEGY